MNPKGNPATLKPYKQKWKSGETQVIRVPKALAGKLLDLARQLDEGKPIQIPVDIDGLILEVLDDPVVTRRGKDVGACRRTLAALAERLKQNAPQSVR